jgi:putative heme-binding domain-containing protein
LLRILRRYADNQWIRSAALCSASVAAANMLVDLSDDDEPVAGVGTARLVIDQLAEIVGARNHRAETDRVLDHVAALWNNAGRREMCEGVIIALARGTRRSGGRLDAGAGSTSPGAQLVAKLIEEARSAVLDNSSSDATRGAAIARLGLLDPRDSRALLARVLEPREPAAVQVAAVRALAESESPEVAKVLLSRLRGFEPSVRTSAIRTLLTRAEWTKALLEAVSRNDPGSVIIPGLIEPADRQPLLKHRDAAIARLAQGLFGRSAPDARKQVIAEYAPTLRLKGGPASGATVFERECKACHKIGARGVAVGPDLTGSPSRDPSALLASILDPNASVSPKDVQYLVIDRKGRTYSGIIAAETATSLTLRRGEGAQDTILRGQVEELTSTGMSLMPEGFEKRISQREMADLIAFVCGAHRDGDTANGQDPDRSRPLDIGTLPGLIEPDE